MRVLLSLFFLLSCSLPSAHGADILNAARKVLEREEPAGAGLEGQVRSSREGLTKDESKTLEGFLTGGASAVYGELLSHAQNTGMANFAAEAWKGGEVARDLAKANRWRGYTGRLNTAIGRSANIVNIAGNIYAGNTDEAAVTGVLAILSELPNLPGGQAMMKYAGIGGPVLTAGILTYQIWKASSEALAKETAGSHLQQLYGTIERMCRDRDRELGVGDPFPVTRENTEKVWRRLITDNSFRESFKSYVVNELKKDFPETGWFRSAADSLYTFGSGQSSEDVQEKRALDELHIRKSEIETYIDGLLSGLNRYWKDREHGIIAVKVGQALAGDIDRASKSLESGLARVAYAAEMLGVVTAYAEKVEERVEKGAEEGDFRYLMNTRKTIEDYVKDVIAWIPDGEPLGEEKKSTFAKLQAGYNAAGKAIQEIRESLEKQIEKPKPTETERSEYVPITAATLYEAHILPVVRSWPEFDWGWTDDAEVMKNDIAEHFSKLFESGKREAMEKSLRAWEKEAFSAALTDLTGAGAGYDIPEKEKTIAYYAGKLRTMSIPTPPELARGAETLPEHREAISRAWQEARRMYGAAVDMKKELIRQQHEEARDWMKAAFSDYEELVRTIGARAEEMRMRFWLAYTSLAPDSPASEKLANVRRTYESNAYAGLPRYPSAPAGVGNFRGTAEKVQTDLKRKRFEIERSLENLEPAVEYIIENLEAGLEKFKSAERDAAPDISIIRTHYDPDFLTDNFMISETGGISYAEVRRASRRTRPYINSIRSEGARLAAQMQQDINNIEMAEFWIVRAMGDYDTFMEMRVRHLIVPAHGWYGREFHEFGQEHESGYTILFGRGEDETLGTYQHFLYEDARQAALSELKQFYETSHMGGFVRQVAPFLKPRFEKLFNGLGNAKGYPHENFLFRMDISNYHFGYSEPEFLITTFGYGQHGLVTTPGVSAARKIMESFIPGSGELNNTLQKMQAHVPLPVFYSGRKIWDESFAAEGTTLGKAYKKLIEDMNKKWAEAFRIASEPAVTGTSGPSQDPPQPPAPEDDYSADIKDLENFYRNFKRAYEARDDIRVLGMLDDGWSSQDGTALADVEDHFRRMFGVFDAIDYEITNISLGRSGDIYRADYDLLIRGRIFRNNIRHEEKSSVTEELRRGRDGRFRVVRTLRGRFWTP